MFQLLILLLGNRNNDYDILSRKPLKEDYYREFNYWIQRNFYTIALAAIIFLLIMFVIVCFSIVGVSAVESGTYYNHLGGL